MKAQTTKPCVSLEIGNEVLSHLMRAALSGTEWSLILAVIQQMSCRDEKAISISLREFHELVGLDQEAIRKGLKTLREKNILVRHKPSSFTTPASWSFNEDWQSWVTPASKRPPRQHTPPPTHTESPSPAQRGVLSEHTVSFSSAPEVPTNAREKPQGESVPATATMNKINTPVVSFEKNKSSSRSSPSTTAVTLAGQLRDAVRVRDPRARAARTEDLTLWARDIDLLMRIDQRTPDEIHRVIEWCQVPGGFWGPNILSGRKLRERDFEFNEARVRPPMLSPSLVREGTKAKRRISIFLDEFHKGGTHLGAGGLGEVYCAEDSILARRMFGKRPSLP